MTQDAFTIFHTANELDTLLKNARVDKINQPEKDSVTFYLRCNNNNYLLTACAKAEFSRLSLTGKPNAQPLEAPAFCMLLRKHLSNSYIKKILPVTDERIIRIDFSCKNELGDSSEKSLYCEIMGKYSNVVLTENGKILGAMKTTSLDSGYVRQIFSGVKYALPAKQDKTSLFSENASKEKLAEYSVETDLADFIFNNFLGISSQTAKEIVYRYFKNVKIFKINDFYSFFYDFYINPPFQPNAVFTKENGGVYAVDYLTINDKKEFYNHLYGAFDEYYSTLIINRSFAAKKNKVKDTINSFLKKQQKKLQIVNEKILTCKDADKNLLFGQIIISNIYKLKGGESFAELNDHTKEDYPLIRIELDKTKSPKQNAERYFKKYEKQKKTLAAVLSQKRDLEELINYLYEILKETENVETIEDFADIEEELRIIGIIKKEQTKKIRIKQTSYRRYVFSGYEILVGKNNVQNERLTFSSDRADVWLHTKDFHSAHVIIKTKGKAVEDKVLLYAAEICAYYSDARTVDKVPVDHTLKKYVKKNNNNVVGSVFYTNQKTLYVTPDPHFSE